MVDLLETMLSEVTYSYTQEYVLEGLLPIVLNHATSVVDRLSLEGASDERFFTGTDLGIAAEWEASLRRSRALLDGFRVPYPADTNLPLPAPTLIYEVKVDANFSRTAEGGHQLLRYARAYPGAKRVLFLPERRIAAYEVWRDQQKSCDAAWQTISWESFHRALTEAGYAARGDGVADLVKMLARNLYPWSTTEVDRQSEQDPEGAGAV